MKSYIVGGAVRDGLLGLPVQDRDHVVVGGTPEQLIALGYAPVGKDFPVFLHPVTHEEYALARTERKTAPGYKGFVFHASPDVSLEDDLVRRDLTINAMAQADDGSIIDPFGGRRDLDARLFRHVSDAFAEDPVRILRLARFAARFADFTVAPETAALMRGMVEVGEVDALVAERVWQELARGLMEIKPSRMFDVLRCCGALARILPEVDALWRLPCGTDANAGAWTMMTLDEAAQQDCSLPIRFAVLMHDIGGAHDAPAARVKLVEQVCRRLKIPNDCRELAVLVVRERGAVQAAAASDARTVVGLLERCDAIRKPQRFADMLRACALVSHRIDAARRTTALLQAALHAALSVDAGAVAAQAIRQYPGEPQKIPEAVRTARVAAVADVTGATGG